MGANCEVQVTFSSNSNHQSMQFSSIVNSVASVVGPIGHKVDGIILQQQYLTTEVNKIKNGEGTHQRGACQQLTHLTKLDFPKFEGDDVKGWLYRCNQYFTVDHIEDVDKFIKNYGPNIDWNEYQEAILKRFITSIEDPLGEIKKLMHTYSLQAYNDEFEVLVNKVDITEKQSISWYLTGLQKEIEIQ
ncbi:uncharacterized protein [Rutidosis leptorrhynchoides]|uniref:uncharacterized protein n=1 Tax=Rutidosis leptorrhynchoides TaxID=125765 RepID=UPI003A98F7AB